jgi:hypothetical protein
MGIWIAKVGAQGPETEALAKKVVTGISPEFTSQLTHPTPLYEHLLANAGV